MGVCTKHPNQTVQEGEFVAQLPYFPPLQSVDDFSPARCVALLQAAAGVAPGSLSMNIHSVRTWTMHAQVAARFKVGWGQPTVLKSIVQ